MTQYTQPVAGQQQQQQLQQTSPPQQQQNPTTQTASNTNNNNNSNTNNNSATPTVPATSTNNNQTQTIAVQQQQQSTNNNYTSQQTAAGGTSSGGGQMYNPQMHAGNVYVPAAHHGMPGPHPPQPGAMYSMIPASNVFVNNIHANVNLHGWPHTAVPSGAWIPSGAPPYMHGDTMEQGAPVMQQMGAMQVALPPAGPLMNTNPGGGGLGPRRGGRGRGGGRGNRRSDYNMQRHSSQHHAHHQQQEGSPGPQSSGGPSNNQQSQEQQTMDSQQMMPAMQSGYAAHAQYAAAAHVQQYPYHTYPAYLAQPQNMIHPGQSAAAQQAAGAPLYFSSMPFYNTPQMYNYSYYPQPVINPAEYHYVPAEDVMGGSVVDERQVSGEASAMMWHQQPMYADEYTMNPMEMHSVTTDDMNHNAGSAAETPTSMLSPNYAPIYDPQMHEMQQQMGVMQIYDDPQIAQMQVMHSQVGGIPQIEDDLSECGSQRSVPIQMVPAGAILTTAAGMPIQVPPHSGEQIQMHPQPTHLLPMANAGAAIIPIEQINQHEQQMHSDNNVIDNNMQGNEYPVSNTMQTCESVTSLNDESLQQSAVENIDQDYQQQLQQLPQHPNVMVDPSTTVHTDIYNNKILMTDVLELPENVPIPQVPAAAPTAIVTTSTAITNVDVAIETTIMQNNPLPQQQQQQYQNEKPQQHVVYQQDKQQQSQYVAIQPQANQNVPALQHQPQQQQPQNYKQQQQQYHQQLQTQPPPQNQQQQHHPQQYPQQQAPPQQTQQHQPQHPPQQQHYQNYDNRKSSQTFGNQQHSRRKYDYHNQGANTNDAPSQHHNPQPTTKTMSWTNSSQHKKSTNTVAVTATPSSTHAAGVSGGNYNKQSNSSTNSSTSTHSHATRTYTNQQHHSYQQQQPHNYNQSQQTQTRNYGAMKMPSSPISTGSAPNNTTTGSTMERKTSQSSDTAKVSHQATSTASTTAAPHQFQQQTATPPLTSNEAGNSAKQNRKQSLGQTAVAATISPEAAAATTASSTASEVSAPSINLAPPASSTTQTASSTPSWASLFTAAAAASSPAAAASSVTTQTNPSMIATTALVSNTSSATYSQKPIAKVAPFESVASVTPASSTVTPGALSYSAASSQNLPTPSASTTNTSGNKKTALDIQRNSLANIDEFSAKFADFLTKYKSDWSTNSLRPRGLTNRSNYCYINSILQALLGCSPLYNLMRSIPKQAANLCEVKTPTVNAMISFMSNFSNLPSGLRLRNAKGGKGNKDDLGAELQCDLAFEPTEIYKLWNDSREEHVEGRQEDAEEFLSYILNKLNDEMLEVVKLIAKPKPEQNGQNEQSEGEEGDVWQMICNNRNKGSVTRQTDFGCTPLSNIFRGELRSRLQREGEHSTDVIQPFFTLPLNIEKAATVKEALEILVGRDQLEGVTGSKTKQEVLAWQQMNVEKLPPILILHLKWFDYRSDGCTKILKKVEFPVDLKIDAKILASKKYSQKQRAYRLFAVVYHDGKEASKGHYITDVYHTGYGSWLRYDDSSVKPIIENHVLLPRTPRVPYLLYYRRCDTIPQQNNNNNNSNNGGGNNNNNNSSAGGNNGGNNSSK